MILFQLMILLIRICIILISIFKKKKLNFNYEIFLEGRSKLFEMKLQIIFLIFLIFCISPSFINTIFTFMIQLSVELLIVCIWVLIFTIEYFCKNFGIIEMITSFIIENIQFIVTFILSIYVVRLIYKVHKWLH